MYSALKGPLLRLLKAPEGEPEPPAGSPGSIEVFRASPRFLKLRMVGLLISAALLFVFEFLPIAASMLVADEPIIVVIGIAILTVTAAFIAMQYFLIRLDYDMRYYVITDRSLRIRQGALIIRESTYTYANVQNLTIQQGPVERLGRIGGRASGPADLSDEVPVVAAADVLDALQTLPDRQRAALSLRYLEELSVAEIADELSVTYTAAESLLARGRRSFERAWQSQGRPHSDWRSRP